MKQRVIGFDLARAYAIFGMYIVNFNTVFGLHNDKSLLGKFLSLFSGNSSTVFVMLAGMGIALMTNRSGYTSEEKNKLRTVIGKRAVFLFVIGLLLSLWWSADILHFYGAYMGIALLILFINKRYYILMAGFLILVFHILLMFIPFETGWNFDTFEYSDSWSFSGFIRNFFYNGWNSVFPWAAYFIMGMYLGRLDCGELKTQKKMFIAGLVLYITITVLQWRSNYMNLSEDVYFYINADYLPPFLPFMLSTIGFGLMMISGFMYLGNIVADKQFAKNVAATGQMTLTHYISHIVFGMLLLAFLADKEYTGHVTQQEPISAFYILLFSIFYFITSYYFSKLWVQKYKNGPLEMIMRKISG
ncbi:DUF418 domain-containing protein [Flavobacterium cerinum]|uniref:DUF418 domain-containing protein n=1 Tax=Flavobacterium cerinum TaxID=2502784 RepID=A0A444HBI8_9FLAO|nr:DUF418 domain-containing protein [Flavobacterium cerinum]RWX00785.1 DUF418 domain-containing protein [Flavobacterium cerinum]